MRKYLQKIVPSFLNGSDFEQSATCSVRNGTFYSYATPIAVRRREGHRVVVYITEEKFSATTSGQQNAIKQLASNWRVVPQATILEMEREEHLKTLEMNWTKLATAQG